MEGTPNDPNPNKPFAKLEVCDTFNSEGRLNPSITVIGKFMCLCVCTCLYLIQEGDLLTDEADVYNQTAPWPIQSDVSDS